MADSQLILELLFLQRRGGCSLTVLCKFMICKFFLKLARDEVSFPSTERAFQALAPMKEKHFACPSLFLIEVW